MVGVKFVYCLVAVVLVVSSGWRSGADCAELPNDLDPWQQIAQHNTVYGQLRPLSAEDVSVDDIYDDVTSEAESDEVMSKRPAFPPSLKFNKERNRVHKRLPVSGIDYDVPQNKMIQIDKEA